MDPTPPRAAERRSGPAGGSLTPTLGEHALTVDSLSKRFGERVAFEDISFEVGGSPQLSSPSTRSAGGPSPRCSTASA
jgi:hypothetical protein